MYHILSIRIKYVIANQEYLNDEIEQLRIGFQDKAVQKPLLLRPHQMRRNVDSE